MGSNPGYLLKSFLLYSIPVYQSNDSFFQVMMVKKMQESDTENEIREAYRVCTFLKFFNVFITTIEVKYNLLLMSFPELNSLS